LGRRKGVRSVGCVGDVKRGRRGWRWDVEEPIFGCWGREGGDVEIE